MTAGLLHRARTRAMSCPATVIANPQDDRSDGDVAAIVQFGIERIHQLERRWSRFLPDSEISGLNRSEGEARSVSRDTIRLVAALVDAWRATDGAFDPTLLVPLVGLGYAASRDDERRRTSLPAGAAPRGRVGEIDVDHSAGWVRVPDGTVIDPGGIGKGLAADIVAEELLDAGAAGACVEIGGDLRVTGAWPDDGAWSVSIAPAVPGEPLRTLRLRDAGVATSSSRFRTWTSDGRRRHHLLDPDRLEPTPTAVASCTVVARSGAEAEAFSKVPFVRGADIGLALLDDRGVAASVTTDAGAHHTTAAWGTGPRGTGIPRETVTDAR